MGRDHNYLPSASKGFTLIELMIAVLIVAITAAIAIPSYTSYLVKSRRTAAQTHLMDIAQRQQQYLLDMRSYAPDLATLSVTTPTTVTRYYTVTLSNTSGPPPTFTATAMPVAGSSQASDGALSIDYTGAKTPANSW
jgi:type IV pilus assembly protein PilE